MEKSIEVNNLTFKYDKEIVLKNINFKIKKGSIVTIIGPNGSGKSTLLKNLASSLRPKEGTILLENKNIKGYSTKDLARQISVVPQNTNIDYDFTAYEIVLMGRHPYIKRFGREMSDDISIVKDVMKKTNVWHLRDRNIRELSGGESKRVIIARALAQEPKVLLLDEPTANLDIHHQMEILELLKRLNKEKAITIVMVLHDINLALRYSDEVILLNKGELVTMGNVEEVITKKNLQNIYNVDIVVDKNKYTKCLEVILLSIS